MVQQSLAVNILHEYPELLRCMVPVGVVLKIGRQRELDAQKGARDRLHVAAQLHDWDGVDKFVDLFAELREVDELADLRYAKWYNKDKKLISLLSRI